MCGIAGIFYKSTTRRQPPPLGEQLVRMMAAMRHRGADSTGYTIAGESLRAGVVLARLCAPGAGNGRAFSAATRAIAKHGGRIQSRHQRGQHLRLTFPCRQDLRALADALLEIPGLEIHSLGHTSEIIKDEGDALAVDAKHQVSQLRGSHGLGHNRLATESQVDVRHSHPFWAYPFPDVTTVHNGQLTNYHKLKRLYEERGYRFQTHNDSELIAVYLADKLAQGAALLEALQDSLADFDGTFTYLVSTSRGIGYAKDKLAAKPLVVMERPDVVALASEEVALRQVFAEEIERTEPQQSLCHVWLN
jgi:glutamate synthase domain-containing protein 1